MVKKLMESIREQKKNSILAMVTISGEVVFEVIIPLLMANLIDYGIDMGDMGYIVKMGIVLLLSALGQLFCGAISGKFAAIASSGFARSLRPGGSGSAVSIRRQGYLEFCPGGFETAGGRRFL